MYKFTTVLLIAVLMSFLFSSCSSSKHTVAQKSKKTYYYTCPMHTEVIEMKPGKCPKCGIKMEEFDLTDMPRRNSGSNYNLHNNSGGSSGSHSGGHH